jgi:predicted O-methyltransferase YrrM
MEKPNLTQSRVPCPSCGKNNTIEGLDDLCQFYKIDKTYKILELGVYSGVSTSLFAYYGKEVIGIDLQAQPSISQIISKYTNITIKDGSISSIVPTLEDEYFDLIYIDADHSYESVLHDIKISLSKLKRGGIMSGHDYAFESVSRAVNEMFPSDKLKMFSDTSWSIRL